MGSISVVLPDSTEARIKLTAFNLDSQGTVKASIQKVLVDKSTSPVEEVTDGPASDLTLTDVQQTSIDNAIQAAVTPILVPIINSAIKAKTLVLKK